MLNVMVTGLLCISMLLVASSCNLCLFTVKFYWNIKKKKKKSQETPVPEIKREKLYMYYFSKFQTKIRLCFHKVAFEIVKRGPKVA